MKEYTEEDRLNDFRFFVKNYQKFFEQYGHCYIAIKYKEILGIYDSAIKGIYDLLDKYPLGTYIIQHCNGDKSGYTTRISGSMIKGEHLL